VSKPTKKRSTIRNIPGHHIGKIAINYHKGPQTRFYPTGIRDLDDFTGGIPSGEMTLLAARPGVGKTSALMQFFENMGAVNDAASGIFSIEMTGKSLVTRLVLARTGLPSIPLRKGELDAKQTKIRDKALAEIAELPIYIDDSSYASIAHVEKVSKAWINAGIEIIGLDYVQLMSVGTKTAGDTRANFVGECAKALKRIAKDNDIPFVALSQLNRESTKGKRKPTAADLKDSGELEQVADNILMFHPDVDNPPYVDIIIEKFRNGPTGVVSVAFDAARTQFQSIKQE
jgi:replicative DNA helicase